mmetsp:Transcript_4498/g.7538  ORF Transcript_4498/g.7538 Transcript_4498/m.7538 type:complete len:739 (+) Transcript_4498:168-2384(+)
MEGKDSSTQNSQAPRRSNHTDAAQTDRTRSSTSRSSRSSNTTRSSNASAAAAPGLTQLEQDAASKTRARAGTTSSSRQDLEDRIAAKTNKNKRTTTTSSTSSVTSSSTRDSKTNVPVNNNTNKKSVVGVTAGTNNSNNKLVYSHDDLNKDDSHRSKEKMESSQSFCDHDKLKSTAGYDAPLSPGGEQKDYVAPRLGESVPTMTVAHGRATEPELEYGTYGGGNNGHGFDDNLAIAVAVSGEEEDHFIPAAIEYDPDSKPPIFRNRRFRFYIIAGSILLIAIGVGAALGAMSSGAAANNEPTAAPLTEREKLGIKKQLITVVGEANLADPTSVHARAANWIINEDPRMLDPEADNLIQRFVLAIFYLSTTERKPWLSCNPPVGDETYECNFTKLAQVFPEVMYENVKWGRWLSYEHECGWAGVFCDEFNQTRAIELPGQEIRGTFPSEIALMPYLQSLSFNWNELYGTMPSELASMKHLLNIELHYNFFTGQVPPEWYGAQALQRVNFAGNFLSGSIPTEIGQLSTMKGFFSFENSIAGTIPTEIGQMKFLSFTRWGRNFMTGTMPSEIGELEKIQELWLHRNQFTGELPSEMGNMRDMGDLRLHFNLWTGVIPEEHYNMPQLRRWDLYDCNITSTISTMIGQMSNLQTYRIRENNFYGNIPTELGDLSGLDSLWLHQNDLVGSVPKELCALRGPSGITVLDADCGPTNGVGEPRLECMMGCCTACCDTATGYCLRETF